MDRPTDLAGTTVGVLGLARTGLATLRWLRARGAEAIAFDDRPETLAAAAGLGFRTGTEADVPGLAMLVTSPGVPLTHPAPHPLIRSAQAAGVAVTGDIDLFTGTLGERRLVAVTGTNGKSTTTALIHHLLQDAGRPTVLGGNIGVPVLELDPGPPDSTVVLELSSFQLDLCSTTSADVAVWLNLTPDHLDRHGTMAGYAAAKRRIFANAKPGAVAVVGIDDAASREVADGLDAAGSYRVVRISAESVPERGVGMLDGALVEAGIGEVARQAAWPALRGAHNAQNAAAAFAAVRALGLSPTQAARGLATFPGLEHRMQTVRDDGRILWVNDSKATNPDAAAKSLASFESIVWIAGGKPKPGGFTSLRPHLGAVRAALLIGAAADEIAADLGDVVPCRKVGTLGAAVAAARHEVDRLGLARAVVLLAPACASFDQFKDYEERGRIFADLVRDAAEGAVEHAA